MCIRDSFYSVPHTYAYKTLILKATPTEVRLLADTCLLYTSR